MPEERHTLSDHLSLQQQETLYEVIQERLDAHGPTMEFHLRDDNLGGDVNNPEEAVEAIEDHLSAIGYELSMYEHLTEIKALLEE